MEQERTLFDAAADLVRSRREASVSLLQRRLELGYAEAVDLMAQLEVAGVVVPPDATGARVVIYETGKSAP